MAAWCTVSPDRRGATRRSSTTRPAPTAPRPHPGCGPPDARARHRHRTRPPPRRPGRQRRGDGGHVIAPAVANRAQVAESLGAEAIGEREPRTRVVREPVHQNDWCSRHRHRSNRRKIAPISKRGAPHRTDLAPGAEDSGACVVDDRHVNCVPVPEVAHSRTTHESCDSSARFEGTLLPRANAGGLNEPDAVVPTRPQHPRSERRSRCTSESSSPRTAPPTATRATCNSHRRCSPVSS